MAYYDYDYIAQRGLAIGWVDITSKIKKPMAKALSQNITEYWIAEMSNYNVPFAFRKTIDELLIWAADNGHKYLLIAAVGNSLSKDYAIPQTMQTFLSTVDDDNFALAGHLLDRKDRFYELHPQSLLVNIDWWESAGRPFYGEETQTAIELPVVERSSENWHDDYTPHWIKRGEGMKTYTGAARGWNLINAALNSDRPVSSFDDTMRRSKVYLYPEVEEDFHNKIHDVLFTLQMQTHFVANTENTPFIPWDKLPFDSFDGAVSTAGGLSPLLVAFSAKLKPGDRLVVADASTLSLNIQKQQYRRHIDLNNLDSEINNILSIMTYDSPYLIHPMLRATRNIPRMQEIMNELKADGLEDYYHDVFVKLDVNFDWLDYMNPFSLDQTIRKFEENKNIYWNISNVYTYQNTSWMYSLSDRLDIERQVIERMAKGKANIYVKSTRGPGKTSNAELAADILGSDKLDLPVWYKELPWT